MALFIWSGNMTISIGNTNVNRTVSKITEGVGGVNKPAVNINVGNGGVNRLVYQSDSSLVNTDFSSKGSSWTEQGGTFTYGSGVTTTTIGTLATNSENFVYLPNWDKIKYITIPFPSTSLTQFTLEADIYMYSPANDYLATVAIGLCNGATAPILTFERVDAWLDEVSQIAACWKGRAEDGVTIYTNKSLSYNGATLSYKLTYNAGAVSFYVNNTLCGTTTIASPVTLDNIKVGVINFHGFFIDTWKVTLLKLTPKLL
jgi:hypothetical protein